MSRKKEPQDKTLASEDIKKEKNDNVTENNQETKHEIKNKETGVSIGNTKMDGKAEKNDVIKDDDKREPHIQHEKTLREEIQEFEEMPEELKEEIKEEIRKEIKKDIKNKEGKVRSYFKRVFSITDNMMSYEEIDAMMREQTVIHGANMWILMLAILIASIGLNVNSTAVIIGAMLISPLMSGILAMGYSIAVRDLQLLEHALVRFGTQVAISLITATIYFSLSPMTTPTAEMIARTSPTLWDVLIALFGGLAGMIGHTRTKHSNVIPGVAIATALMPPLCTAGYGIATGQLDFFLGAFYLFIINTLFIAISTAIITLVLRVPYHRSISAKKQRQVNAIIITIAVVVIIPSVFIGARTVYKSYMQTNITSYLEKEFSFSETQIVKSEYDIDEKVISVSLVGSTVPDDVIEMLKGQLEHYDLGDYTLRVTQNVFSEDDESDNSDKVTIVVQENTIKELSDELAQCNETITSMQAVMDGYEETISDYEDIKTLAAKAQRIYPHLSDCYVGVMFNGTSDVIFLSAKASEEIEDYELSSIKSWLCTESGLKKADVYITVEVSEEEEQQ
ncbi:MAG: DUF389 domain-containing protein [Clostridium sp.]|nr:DUF389 domain-containing protein [Clostridium sp.]MCM1398501.1 DUF389 domain-containing protein [Clostridium sp.]MCM1460223.1 DUF389 domain-containing protein [Bacteroides sp.]